VGGIASDEYFNAPKGIRLFYTEHDNSTSNRKLKTERKISMPRRALGSFTQHEKDDYDNIIPFWDFNAPKGIRLFYTEDEDEHRHTGKRPISMPRRALGSFTPDCVQIAKSYCDVPGFQCPEGH